MKSLKVKYRDSVVGTLFQDKIGKMSFQYDSQWIKDEFAISVSLPLQNEIFEEKKCRAFFEGLLPEDSIRYEIARNLRISSRNDFALLEAIGGDCAGAIRIESENQNRITAYKEKFDESNLGAIFSKLNETPLLAGVKDVRLSIAGSQRKLPIIVENDEFFIPHGDIPTTFIIKPEIPGFDGSVDNEMYCMFLAQKIGMPTANVKCLSFRSSYLSLHNSGTTSPESSHKKYLLIKRYDRKTENEEVIRIHQEDLCQATGIPSENKYQQYGGPGFVDIFKIIKNYSTCHVIDIKNIIRIAIFNYIIGNADAHGKNFSFLLTKNGIQLAPFYDLLSTEIYPGLSKKIAMKIGGKYNFDEIFKRHWHKFAEENLISQTEINRELEYVSDTVNQEYKTVAKDLFGNDEKIRPKVITDIINLINKRLSVLQKK
jgi:serine/threonine-protein kinase HipA